MAATGFQRGCLNLQQIHDLFIEVLKSDKEINFIQEQLRSGKDIFIHGGHVTKVFSDRIFRLLYDNKRFIINDKSKTLLDSRPLHSVNEGALLRYISKLPKMAQYTRNMSNSVSGKYKSKLELIVRNFLKALLKNNLNLKLEEFNSYKDIINYLKNFNNKISINENSIAQLKRRGSFCKVERTLESESFVKYIKLKFPNFNELQFYKDVNK